MEEEITRLGLGGRLRVCQRSRGGGSGLNSVDHRWEDGEEWRAGHTRDITRVQ